MTAPFRRRLYLGTAMVVLLVSWPARAEQMAEDPRIDALTRRIEALERLLGPVIGQAEQIAREQYILRGDLDQFALQSRNELGKLQDRINAQELSVKTPPNILPEPTTARDNPPLQAADYLVRARASLAAGSWAQAEFDAVTLHTMSQDAAIQTEATHLLGRSLLGQGQAALAAEKFLEVYDRQPAAALGATNLFYLGEALRQLNLPDNSQLCAVYAQALHDYGAELQAEQLSEIRAHLADQNCQ